MKKIKVLFTVLFVFGFQIASACDLCKKNQPAGFENITHGAGPSGPMDYFIIWGSILVVIVTLFLTLKYLIKPKEGNPDHIKNIVTNQGF
jgi:hypothetical protein